MKQTLKTIMIAVMLLTAPAVFAQEGQPQQGQPQPEMPPRMVGSLAIDPLTQAPLQVAYTAYLKASPQEVYGTVSGEAKGKLIKSSAKEGFVVWSATGKGYADHLGVIALMPAPQGGTAINWQSYYNHADAASIAKKQAGNIQATIEGLTKKFGGMFTGAAYGNSTINVISDIYIDKPIEVVWKASADDFGSVDQWSSMVGKADLYGAGADAGRTCHVNMPGNPSVDEKIISYDKANHTFAYTVQGAVMPPFVTKALNTWKLKDLGNSKTHLRAHMTIDVAPEAPAPAVGMVKGQFFHMLSMGMEEFEYFVESGTPHARKLASIEMMQKMADEK